MISQPLNISQSDILVVDDTLDNLRLLSAMLIEKGYQVRKALNGNLALTACQMALPNLILLDIMMPEMDGYEVCQRLKADPVTRDIPIIFISAIDDVENKVKAFEMGGIDYVTKPFQAAEIISRIETHLKMRSLQIQLQDKNQSLQTEITERQKIQSALELSETRNQALIQAIPDIMLRLDRQGQLLDYRLPGKVLDSFPENSLQKNYAQPEFFPSHCNCIGKNIREIFSGDLALWLEHYVEQTLLKSTIQIAEYMEKISGTWHAYEVRFVKSNPDEVLALVRDISERKHAEAQRLQSEALLRSQKQELERALSELKSAQVQLIQNEKMVALGQLVAGIAHEINNPISFIYSNLAYANDYVQDLVKMIHLYQNTYPNPPEKLQESIKKFDLNFILEDVQNLMNAMQRGAERIRQIVLSLRNFSRLDESGMKRVDIHEGLDSTLVMLQNRLRETETRPQINIIKNYGNLPQITCYPSQVNQVFMHLLTNAIDALEMHNSTLSRVEWETEDAEPLVPKIRISTELTHSQTIKIRIADNGPGIEKSVLSRLFDPFFTTKPVGKGTGLGLSISYQIIVQKHGGQFTCCSAPGHGSEFAIEIPVHQPGK